jgi:hypothetical protein
VNKLWRNLNADSKPHCRNTEPEQLSPEKQNHDSDEYSNDSDREMHRGKSGLSSHGAVEAFVTNACLPDVST